MGGGYAAGRKVDYFYDSDPVNRPPGFETNNNRLLWYVESVADGQGGWTALRTVRYTYYVTGHVANITVKDEYVDPVRTPGVPADYEWYHDLALYYSSSGKLWRVLRDQWKEPSPGQFSDYTKVAAREFYYDAPWERYMDRDVDKDTWAQIGAGRWSDYERSLIYQDFLHTPAGGPDEQTRYLSELGTHAQQTVSTGATRYLHGDLIDSTMLTTGDGGGPLATLAYTAFGEPIGDPAGLGTRYQYAGGWGYESSLLELPGANPLLAPVTLVHGGSRWYQPEIGRLIQRDCFGATGGLNSYEYALRVGPGTRYDTPFALILGPLTGPPYRGQEFLQRLLQRLWHRWFPPPSGTAGAVVANTRVAKKSDPLLRPAGSSDTTNFWAKQLYRLTGWGRAATAIRFGAKWVILPVGLAYDLFCLAREAPYAWYGVPPGEY